jgi:hypothetical protein
MGIWTKSKLIFGWEIDYKKAADFLIKNKVGSCIGDFEEYDYNKDNLGDDDPDDIKQCNREQQCFCGSMCWGDLASIPEGTTILQTSPSYDIDPTECRYFVSLFPGDINSCSLDEFNKITKNDIEKARKFAIMLGGDGDQPHFMSEVDIT